MAPPQPKNYNPGDIRGIDVSHYQGTINWQKVAASNVVFGIAKATDGLGLKDTHFTDNYEGMRSNGILRGAYHFFRPKLDAKAQADSFLHVVKQLKPGDLPPALDVESDGGKPASVIIKGIRTWIDEVEKALGRTPMIYTGGFFWNSKVAGTDEFAENPLWVAHYTSKPKPNMPKGFPAYAIWQFTSKGGAAVSGINTGPGKDLDLDRFNGTMDDLRKLAGL
ncbi:MAG TPA: GH25 family lysozyme [Pyrinomonadaceae bacterium]|nr:GH25 family lysozyme [Pyrinomonadaceae bacterium]